MESKLDLYKRDLRMCDHYKDFYRETVEDFRNLVSISPEKAKQFAIRIIAEKSKLNNDFKGELLNYNNEAELEAKRQIDAESLAILDIDFSRLFEMENIGKATWRLNNIKAMLKNQATIVEPAQTSIDEYDDTVVEHNENEVVEDFSELATTPKVSGVLHTTPNFLNIPRETQAKRIRKFLLKDITEQLYRNNFEYFVQANEEINKILVPEKHCFSQARIDENYLDCEKVFRKKEAVANLLNIFGALSTPRVAGDAAKTMVKLQETARDINVKLNRKPTIAEMDVLLAETMLRDIDHLIDTALDCAEQNPEQFKDVRSVVKFLNVWYDNFNNGDVLEQGYKNFGASVNEYANNNTNKIVRYATCYETAKRTPIQKELGL